MKRILLLIFLLGKVYGSHAQVNLVPNPSFENKINCPSALGEIICPLNTPSPFLQTAEKWISPVPNSPDYYNACATDSNAGVPANYMGYIPAHTGNAYAGIVVYSATAAGQQVNYQEFLQVQLDSALRPGQRYLVSCYARPAFVREPFSSFKAMALQWINAGFTDSMMVQYTPPLLILSETPMQDTAKDFIADTTGWTYIYGYYIAKGGERWLTLGNFYNKYPPLIEIYPLNGSPVSSVHGYYMIDDVSVTTAPPCDTNIYRHDTVLCSYPAVPYTMASSVANAGSYIWNNGGTSSLLATDKSGKYWCTAVTDCNVVTDTFYVSYFRDTFRKALETVTCDTVHTFYGRPGSSLYRWSTGDTSYSITVNNYGIYTCTSLVSCSLYIDEYDVSPVERPYVTTISLGDDTVVCSGEKYSIGKSFSFARSYRWNTGDTVCCIAPVASGRYTLTIADECYSYTDDIYLEVQNCNRCLIVPTAFSPNKDGLNDNFGVTALCTISSFSMYIYNRWGQAVFTTQDINSRWNSLYKNDFSPAGTYHYYIQYSTPLLPGIQTLKGDILLLR